MKFNSQTYISLGVAIAMLGGVSWLTTIWMNTEVNASEIQDIKQLHSNMFNNVADMKKTLYRLEAKVDTLPRLLKYELNSENKD